MYLFNRLYPNVSYSMERLASALRNPERELNSKIKLVDFYRKIKMDIDRSSNDRESSRLFANNDRENLFLWHGITNLMSTYIASNIVFFLIRSLFHAKRFTSRIHRTLICNSIFTTAYHTLQGKDVINILPYSDLLIRLSCKKNSITTLNQARESNR